MAATVGGLPGQQLSLDLSFRVKLTELMDLTESRI